MYPAFVLFIFSSIFIAIRHIDLVVETQIYNHRQEVVSYTICKWYKNEYMQSRTMIRRTIDLLCETITLQYFL